jgi:hypothetical protein
MRRWSDLGSAARSGRVRHPRGWAICRPAAHEKVLHNPGRLLPFLERWALGLEGDGPWVWPACSSVSWS